MSMLESPARESAKALRRRLFQPINGRLSTELEIIPQWVADKARYQREEAERLAQAAEEDRLAKLDFERRAALEAAVAAEADRTETVPNAKAFDAEELKPRLPRVEEIVREVCRRYHVSRTDIMSARRTANVVLPRQIVMFLARQITLLSLPQIGARLGHRDHTTIHHGAKKIARLVEGYPHLAAEIVDIKKTLGVE